MLVSIIANIQRLADVYLMKAEAILGNNESTSDPEALAAFDAVHNRARVEAVHPTSITLKDLIRERRIEFCMEYFNWWDMVTWYRWKPQTMLNFFNRQQHRAFEIRENSLYRNSNGTFSYRVIPPGTGTSLSSQTCSSSSSPVTSVIYTFSISTRL